MNTQAGGGGGEQKRQALIGVNDLNYVFPPDLAVSVNRTHTNHYFQNSAYTNAQRAICILNSGAHYGDMRQSSLEFGVSWINASVGQKEWFGKNGSAINLIETLTITSRSGDELVRINQEALLRYYTNAYGQTENFVKTVGSGMGYSESFYGDDHVRPESHFSIPLSCLTEFFAYDRLMPAPLLSGLRISITWTDPLKAGIGLDVDGTTATTALTGYNIVNPYIALYATQLTDGVQRALNEFSAVNGLEIAYCDWEPTQQNIPTATATTVQIEVRKAASRALQVFTVTRNTNNENLNTEDGFASIPWDYERWQYQLGSLYFPQQPVISADVGTAIEDQTATAIPESYKHALIAWNSYKGGAVPCSAVPLRWTNNYLEERGEGGALVTTTEYTQAQNSQNGIPASNNGQWGTYAHGLSTIAHTLERTDLFNLSGVPINNSRVLSFRASYKATSTVPRTITVWLKYVRLARVFMNNVEVEQ